jgi:GNAT superfamily N-acetyltransferase
MWRRAEPAEDERIVALGLALSAEDEGQDPVPAEHIRRTLRALREAPQRGCAIVLDVGGPASGYALLIPFWSNELGGEVCAIDELYVAREWRGRGYARALIDGLAAGTLPGAEHAVALTVEVTPGNDHARRLYERSGFAGANRAMRRRIDRSK